MVLLLINCLNLTGVTTPFVIPLIHFHNFLITSAAIPGLSLMCNFLKHSRKACLTSSSDGVVGGLTVGVVAVDDVLLDVGSSVVAVVADSVLRVGGSSVVVLLAGPTVLVAD